MTKLTEVFLLIFSNLAGTTSKQFQIGPTGQILSSVGTNDVLDVVKNGGVGYADLNVGNLLINNKPVFNSEGVAIKAENGVTPEQAEVWDSKANRPNIMFITVKASNWYGESAPFTTTLRAEGLKPSNTGIIGLPFSITDEQFNAAAEAQLRLVSVQRDSFQLQAYGVKPEIDIPIQITIVG